MPDPPLPQPSLLIADGAVWDGDGFSGSSCEITKRLGEFSSCNRVSLPAKVAALMQLPHTKESPGPVVQSLEDCYTPLICPLNAVQPGAMVRIKKLPQSHELAGRLRELGFCEEQRIRMLARHSQVICQVCNSRLGISDRLAATILVETLPDYRAA